MSQLNTPEYKKEAYDNMLKYIEEGKFPQYFPYLAAFDHMAFNGLLDDKVEEIQAFVNKLKIDLLEEKKQARRNYNKEELRSVERKKKTFSSHWRVEYMIKWTKEQIK